MKKVRRILIGILMLLAAVPAAISAPLLTDQAQVELTLNNTPNDSTANANNFSNTGSPTYVLNGNPYDYCLLLNGTNQGLTKADNASVSATGQLTLYITVIPYAKTGTTAVFSKDDFGVAGARSYSIVCNGTADRWQFEVWDSSNNATTVTANNFGSIQLNAPQTIVARVTAAGVASIQVNGGTPDTASGVTSIKDSATALDIGTRRNNGTATSFFNGLVRGPVVMAKRAWTDAEVGYVYNGGKHRKFSSNIQSDPQFVEPLITSMRAYPRQASLHYSTLTFQTAANYELGIPSEAPADDFDPVDYDHWENYFDQLEKLGIQEICITSKHWNGFCLWPSATNDYNITQTPFWARTGINVLKDFCDAARARGLRVNLYYCVKCEWFDEEYSGPLTRQTYTFAMLRELLGGDYGLFDWVVLDAYGDNFWDTSDGWSYTDVDYDACYKLIKSLQPNCLVKVNDHDDTGTSVPGTYRRVPGDWRTFEVPVEGVCPANYYNMPLASSWQTLQPNWTDNSTRWFEHADSIQPTPANMKVPIGNIYSSIYRGGIALTNICAGPTGQVPAAMQTAANEFYDYPADVVLNETLVATAGTTLQAHNAAWSKTAGGQDILINPSGSAYSNNDFIEYNYTGSTTTGDFQIETYFAPLTLTNFQHYLFAQRTGNTDVRVYFTRSALGLCSVEMYRNNNGSLVLLDSFTCGNDMTATRLYRLKLFKRGNELRGEVMEYLGADAGYVTIGRAMATSNHTSSGTCGMGLFETAGAPTTGCHILRWTNGTFDTTAPSAPTITIANESISITKPASADRVKLYRSADSGKTWVPAAYLRSTAFTSNVATFNDPAIGDPALYRWRAVAMDPSFNTSTDSNKVGGRGVRDAVTPVYVH